MPAKASAKFVRISPFKVRQVANVVRGMNVNEAMNMLKHMNKRAALPLFRLIQSAVANATDLADETNPVDVDRLFVETLRADTTSHDHCWTSRIEPGTEISMSPRILTAQASRTPLARSSALMCSASVGRDGQSPDLTVTRH